MTYEIRRLTDNLVYITWHTSPALGSSEESRFLRDVRDILTTAQQPQYFLSDLRKGRITNVKMLHRISKLAEQPTWGGGASFSQDPLTSMFVEMFAEFVQSTAQRSDGIFDTLEDAIAHLDGLCPGMADSVNWAEIVQQHVEQ